MSLAEASVTIRYPKLCSDATEMGPVKAEESREVYPLKLQQPTRTVRVGGGVCVTERVGVNVPERENVFD
jgi:hypothetical protein